MYTVYYTILITITTNNNDNNNEEIYNFIITFGYTYLIMLEFQ